MLCKEGISRDVLGEKLRRNKEISNLLPRQLTADKLCCRAFSSGIVAQSSRILESPETFRTRKAIRKTPTRLFCKAGLFMCCKGSKNQNNCKISWFETISF